MKNDKESIRELESEISALKAKIIQSIPANEKYIVILLALNEVATTMFARYYQSLND